MRRVCSQALKRKTGPSHKEKLPRRTELISRSLEIICGLQQEDGGITATPADDAYPYVYPRDAVVMAMSMNRYGLSDRSKKFFRYLTRVARPNGAVLQRYNKGYPSVSQPGQYDVTPLVLQGIEDTYSRSGDRTFLESMWNLTSEGAASVVGSIEPTQGLVYTVRSIHENQTLEDGFEIWANCAAVRGLLSASIIANELGQVELAREWRVRSEVLMKYIVEKLFDAENRFFIKNLRRDGTRVKAPDISQLAPFYFGIFQDDAVLESTLANLKKTLWSEETGGFGRFRDFEVVKDWHWYTGGIGGAWPMFTIWAARFYRQLGISEEVERCLDFVLRSATGEMFLPEKVAPVAGYALWKKNEMGCNDRILNGIHKVEGGRFRISIPEHVVWACPLGWAHAEYLALEAGNEARQEAVIPELHARTASGF